MQLLDLDDVVGFGDGALEVAPVEGSVPDDVRPGFVVEDRRAVILRASSVDQRLEWLELHLDQLGRVAGEFSRGGDHCSDRLAEVTHLTDGERVILHVRAGRNGELEEWVGQDRDLVPGQRAVDALKLERLRDVDGLDPSVRIRRANEMHVAHLVPLDVVEEHTFALQEPLVFLPRNVLAGPALLWLALLDDDGSRGRDGRFRHADTDLIASTMFT